MIHQQVPAKRISQKKKRKKKKELATSANTWTPTAQQASAIVPDDTRQCAGGRIGSVQMRRCVKCSKRRGTYPLGVHPVHAVSNHLDSTKRGRRRGSAEVETSRVGRRRAAPFFTAHANNTNNGSGRTPVAASAKTKPTNGTETQVEARAT